MILLVELSSLLIHNRGRNFFLPAHSRGLALPRSLKRILSEKPGVWDLPELPDIGSPLDDFGAVSESQRVSASLFGAENVWYGVNGATGLLQAALFSMLRPGESVLMPRNIHRSLIYACALGDFIPVLFDLPYQPELGHSLPPDKEWMGKVLKKIREKGIKISAAVLVNPTYHGYSSDITDLVHILHKFDLPVLVDEAHGAHFAIDIGNALPTSAITAGADLVVHSLHKSSIGLTQTAVLWSQGTIIDPILVKRNIGSLQTSSPSALLLASCETALREWVGSKGKNQFLERIDQANNLAFELRKSGIPIINNDDPFRLILNTASYGISGFEADKFFIKRGLIAELPEPGSLTFCLGFAAYKGVFSAFKKLWNQLLKEYPNRKPLQNFSPPPIPLVINSSMNCSKAWRAKSISVDLKEAKGKISADIICPYPPGIPMLIPGEELDEARLDWLAVQNDLWPEQIPSKLRVVC